MDFTPNGAVLNATGEVFKLYGAHFGAGMIPVDLTGNAPQPDPKYPVGYDHLNVNAVSATYPLDMIAALSPDRKTLTIAVVNATHTTQSARSEELPPDLQQPMSQSSAVF